MKVAINGFGRIGRMFFRSALKMGIDVCAINDLSDVEMMRHLLTHDSVHGGFNARVEVENGNLVVNGKEINVTSEREPENLPWKKLGVDVVVESSGVFRKRELAEKHLKAGAKLVIISAPPKSEGIDEIVLGVNDFRLDEIELENNVISMASCTTNCLAPMVKVLDESFGIKRGFMTTVHAYTNDQRILDVVHKDVRRARAAAVNIIPTTTGAAKSVGRVYPKVAGKLTGIALRVPVADGSITDLTVELEREASRDEINEKFKEASAGKLKGILEYSEEPLVSSDIVGRTASCIIDALLTSSIESVAKVLGWYDNEAGYSTRLAELVNLISRKTGW